MRQQKNNKNFIVQMEKKFNLLVKTLRSDNWTKFKNEVLDIFCVSKGIVRQFSIPRHPQQNRVVEKNRTLIEAAKSMVADSWLHVYFWVEAANTTWYVQNKILINHIHEQTAYWWFNKSSTIC